MKILFQGDSITDMLRDREDLYSVGTGYPLLVKAALGLREPDKYEFINKGVSGNRVVDVYSRVKNDIINLKPDVLSLLVGANDVILELPDFYNGIDAEKYERIYSMMLKEIKDALPQVKIMLAEPFFLKGSATNEHWDYVYSEIRKRSEVVQRLAKEYNAVFVPLQEEFNRLYNTAKPGYWSCDGVHPTPMGHELIKNEWIKYFDKMLEE